MKDKRKPLFWWGLATGLMLSNSVAAQSVFSVKVENDMFASGEDGHYTNGVELNWTFEPSPDHWTQLLAQGLPQSIMSNAGGVSYRFGQQIYTPNEISRSELISDDRPYAGLLFGGVSLHNDVQQDNWRQATDLHVDVGLVGPDSLAENIQREVHKITDSDKPQGWRHQLDNEPILNLGYRRQWWRMHSVGGKGLEHGPSVSAALGNLYTYAGAGYGVRWGDRSYGLPAVAPAQGGRQYFSRTEDFGWYVFASVEGRYMAHNLLLDGNTFGDSHSVDRNEWVGDAQVGVAATWEQWQLAYTAVWRTKEFDTQKEHDKFGSLTLSRHF
ncbi:lipid A deacylase LpxR family protein [Halomonas sp. Bachu 37]|uniref:lipid A deacylase LpxR family protein n=1 Tax=Halomonas kashgarensis TaxID=3084920 RepID=UPI00321757EF